MLGEYLAKQETSTKNLVKGTTLLFAYVALESPDVFEILCDDLAMGFKRFLILSAEIARRIQYLLFSSFFLICNFRKILSCIRQSIKQNDALGKLVCEFGEKPYVGNLGETTEPLFSIVIPYFNASKFIGATLDSVFSATRNNFECIVVDDGSSKVEARKLLNEIRQRNSPKIKLIQTENFGLASARNAGVRSSVGKYIKFLDADDLLLPNSLDHELLGALVSDSDVVISSTLYWLQKRGFALPSFPKKRMRSWVSSPKAVQIFFRFWEQGLTLPIHSALFKRAVIPEFVAELRNREDFVFWLDLMAMRPKVLIRSNLVGVYRVHSNQMTARPKKEQRMALEIALKTIESRFSAQINPQLMRAKRDYADAVYCALDASSSKSL